MKKWLSLMILLALGSIALWGCGGAANPFPRGTMEDARRNGRSLGAYRPAATSSLRTIAMCARRLTLAHRK